MTSKKDYRVEVKIKNNLLYSAIIEDSDSIAAFCKKYGICLTTVVNFINMKEKSIYLKDGMTLRQPIQVLCDILQKSVTELFPEQYYLPKNKFSITANRKDLVPLSYNNNEVLQIACSESSENSLFQKELIETLDQTLDTLNPREKYIIRMHFLNNESMYDIAKKLGIGPQRVYQIENKALAKLKHPSRSRKLRYFLEDFEYAA